MPNNLGIRKLSEIKNFFMAEGKLEKIIIP